MLKSRTWSQLMDLPKPPMHIEGILPQNGLLLLQSHSGVGKTFFALELGIAVCTGLRAFEKFVVTQAGKVLYVGEDAPDWDVKEQARKLAAHKGLSARDFDLPWETDADGHIDLESGPQFEFSINEGAHLNSDAGVDEIIARIDAIGAKVVILDTLSALNTGNENDNGWMNVIMRRIKRIRKHAAVILLHHTSKPGEVERPGPTGARGASAIGASLDGGFGLTKRQGKIAVRIVKQRSFRMTEFDYIIESDDDQAALVIIESSSPIKEAVLKFLKEKGTAGRADMLPVVKKLSPGASDSVVANRWWASMQSLMAEGKVAKAGRNLYKFSND